MQAKSVTSHLIHPKQPQIFRLSVMKLKNNISHVETCFDQIIFFLQMTSKHSLQNWFRKPRITTNPFRKFRLLYPKLQKSLKPLSTQYKIFKTRSMLFQMFPDSDHISSQDILEKARQTEETTQEMSVIVNHNKENALEINNIVERFS